MTLTNELGESSELGGVSELLSVEGNGSFGRQGHERLQGGGEADVSGTDAAQQDVAVPAIIVGLVKLRTKAVAQRQRSWVRLH